jgi:formate dehydrogenase subunit delta
MKPSKLLNMANQIGAFFEAMPDREQGINDVADHILRFWEPRMRTGLLDYIDVAGDGELKPIVRDALPMLRER